MVCSRCGTTAPRQAATAMTISRFCWDSPGAGPGWAGRGVRVAPGGGCVIAGDRHDFESPAACAWCSTAHMPTGRSAPARAVRPHRPRALPLARYLASAAAGRPKAQSPWSRPAAGSLAHQRPCPPVPSTHPRPAPPPFACHRLAAPAAMGRCSGWHQEMTVADLAGGRCTTGAPASSPRSLRRR